MNMRIIRRVTPGRKLSDLDQGKWLYKHFYGIECCTTEQMRRGWRLAEAHDKRWYRSIKTNTAADLAAVGEDESWSSTQN